MPKTELLIKQTNEDKGIGSNPFRFHFPIRGLCVGVLADSLKGWVECRCAFAGSGVVRLYQFLSNGDTCFRLLQVKQQVELGMQ